MKVRGEERPVAARPDLSPVSEERSESAVEDYVYEDEAERSLAGAIENSCIICSRTFGKNQIRVVIPKYMLEQDYYYSNNYVSRRFMCMECYGESKAKIHEEMGTETARTRIRPRLANPVAR